MDTSVPKDILGTDLKPSAGARQRECRVFIRDSKVDVYSVLVILYIHVSHVHVQ